LLSCALLGLWTQVLAQPERPRQIVFHFLKAKTPGEKSALSGECDGTTANREVTCRFTQVAVRYKLEPNEVSAELDRRLKDAREAAASDPKRFEIEMNKNMCADIKKVGVEKKRELEKMSALGRRRINDFLEFCSKPTLAAFERLMEKSVLEESRTCLVYSFQNDPITFKKVGPNKWLANVGPKGTCDAIYLYEMENDAQTSGLWRWSQVRTYANKSKPLCGDTPVNDKVEYGWDGEDVEMHCEIISFGM